MSVTAYNASSTLLKTSSATSTSSSKTKKSSTSGSLTSDDFLTLFVKQLQNQDSTNPMDSSEMMSQITQLSNMQMMQNMANYSQANYAVSLVGKYVTASVADGSKTTTITGTIDRMVSKDGSYTFYVGDKSFSSDDITAISTAPAAETTAATGSTAAGTTT